MTFDELLAENPQLQRVGFYYLDCSACGKMRMLANGVVPGACPQCGQPAQLVRTRMRCATSKPVPLVQKWKCDNAEGPRYNTAPWRQGELEEC